MLLEVIHWSSSLSSLFSSNFDDTINIIQALRYSNNDIRGFKYPNNDIQPLKYFNDIRVLEYSDNNVRPLKYLNNIGRIYDQSGKFLYF